MKRNKKMAGNMEKINNVFMKKGALIIAFSCFAPSVAYATNGLFMIGYGTKSRGMGGAAIAMPVDSISGWANPANLSAVGGQIDVGIDFFTAKVTGQLGSTASDSNVDLFKVNNLFPMPAVGFSYPLNEKFTFGATMIPAGGGATNYDTNFYQAAAGGDTTEKLKITLITMQTHFMLSYKMNKHHSFGASFIFGTQVFEARGLQLFDPFTQTSGTDKGFSNQGYDWSVGGGLKFGWLGTFDKLRLGVSYQSRIYFENFEKYTELFAENGAFDTPPIFGVGASYKIKPSWTATIDVTYTFYEDVKSMSNPGPNLAGDSRGVMDPATQSLGLPGGLGFGWSNQTVFKLGTEYGFNDKWIGRIGWNYGKSPINEDSEIIFNLIAPAISQNHLTLGGTYNISPTMEVNASYVHAFRFKQSGPTYVSDDGSNQGSLEMSQDSIGVSLSMMF